MLTLSILWVVLAATVTTIAITRTTPAGMQDAVVRVRESGRALTLLAAVYGVALLAGFVYVSKFIVSGF